MDVIRVLGDEGESVVENVLEIINLRDWEDSNVIERNGEVGMGFWIDWEDVNFCI